MKVVVAVGICVVLWIGLLWFLFKDARRYWRSRRTCDVPLGRIRVGVDHTPAGTTTVVIGQDDDGVMHVLEVDGPRPVEGPGASDQSKGTPNG